MKAAAKVVPDDVLRRIQAVVGPKGWTADPAEMAPYLEDERGHYHGRSAMVVKPRTTAEVSEVVRLCAEAGIAIVPQGGNTSLVGASVPFEHGGEILVNLSRLNRIRATDPLNYTITVEAGSVLADVQEAAAAVDRLFPLSLGAEGSCQIGGNLSTNAGGMQVLRYGTARNLVLGLEVVLPDGRLWDGLKGLRKDNTGYDLKQLFIGAEGTLGIITAAVLRLFPRPREVATALVAMAELDGAVELLARTRAASGDLVTGFELVPRTGIDLALEHVPATRDPFAEQHEHAVLIELTSSEASSALRESLEAMLARALEDGLVLDAVVAASESQVRQLWQIRTAIPEAEKIAGGGIKHDVSVPVARIPDFIREATAGCRRELEGVRILAFGHLGDGNIHFNLMGPAGGEKQAFLALGPRFNRIVHDVVASMGGSISGEHGIGRLNREALRRYTSDVELDLMRRLKAALDPKGIMNPGKVI